MPCGRFFHSAKATFHQPPQHLKQACSLIPCRKSYTMLSVCWQMHPKLYFVFRKDTKNANAKMHLLNPLQAAKQFCSFHSVTPLPHTALPKHSVKSNQIGLRSLLPFRCIPFQAFVPHDPFTPLHLHSISHLSSKSKSASHPCPLLQIPSILQNQPSI